MRKLLLMIVPGLLLLASCTTVVDPTNDVVVVPDVSSRETRCNTIYLPALALAEATGSSTVAIPGTGQTFSVAGLRAFVAAFCVSGA